MRGRATVKGGTETREAFRQIRSEFGPALNKVSRLAMAPVLKEARANAPKDTGRLKKSLVLRLVKGRPKNAPETRVGVSGRSRALRYSHLAEFGRAGAGGYPGSRFMTRAFESTRGEVHHLIATHWPRILAERIAYLKSKGVGKVKL
jgi:HK97 gp10 family phage protein